MDIHNLQFVAPTLTGISIFCLARRDSAWFTRIFGGSNGNEGLGMFSLCLDWNYVGSGGGSLGALFTPFTTQVSQYIGVALCIMIFCGMYATNACVLFFTAKVNRRETDAACSSAAGIRRSSPSCRSSSSSRTAASTTRRCVWNHCFLRSTELPRCQLDLTMVAPAAHPHGHLRPEQDCARYLRPAVVCGYVIARTLTPEKPSLTLQSPQVLTRSTTSAATLPLELLSPMSDCGSRLLSIRDAVCAWKRPY